MADDTSSCFSVPHLRHFVEQGQWKDAVEYLLKFLPPEGLDSLGLEAQILRRFLVAHMALANIIAGTKEGDVLAEKYRKYRDHGSSVCHGIIRLRSIMLTTLHAKQQLRDSWDWECVWRTASEIVDDLAYRTSELMKDLVLNPGGPMKETRNVFPIGFSSRNRRPHKKQSRRIRASVLAKGYLHKKRSLLPSSRSQESPDELLNKAMNCVADAVDKSLKAGKRPHLNQDHPLEPSGREGATVAPVQPTILGATVAPVLQTMIGTFPGTAKITGNPSIANAVTNADKLTRRVLSSGAPFSRVMFGSPVLRTMSGSLITPATNSRVSWITNTGTTVAPVSQAMFGPMPGPTRNPEIPSMANAGLSSHVQNSVVPVSQTVLGCLTNPDKSSPISLITDAGTIEHSSQEGFDSKCARQGIITRKHTREEFSTDEQDLPSKLQRARGSFSEASL